MHSFEQLAAICLEHEGYWTRIGYKFKNNKKDKNGKRTSPRHEVDLIAYRPRDNELIFYECKSYLDSTGVCKASFDTKAKRGQIKVFCDKNIEADVLKEGKNELIKDRLIDDLVQPKLGLIAGKIQKKSKDDVFNLFRNKEWVLKDAKWMVDTLRKISGGKYEDSLVHMTSKIIFRNDERCKKR